MSGADIVGNASFQLTLGNRTTIPTSLGKSNPKTMAAKIQSNTWLDNWQPRGPQQIGI